jgi:hypothetical protein
MSSCTSPWFTKHAKGFSCVCDDASQLLHAFDDDNVDDELQSPVMAAVAYSESLLAPSSFVIAASALNLLALLLAVVLSPNTRAGRYCNELSRTACHRTSTASFTGTTSTRESGWSVTTS